MSTHDDPREPLFTTPAAAPDEGSGFEAFKTGAFAVMFAAFAVAVNVWWDRVHLPEGSYAGGRTASLRRLAGTIGRVPLTLIFVVLAVALTAAAVSELRRRPRGG